MPWKVSIGELFQGYKFFILLFGNEDSDEKNVLPLGGHFINSMLNPKHLV